MENERRSTLVGTRGRTFFKSRKCTEGCPRWRLLEEGREGSREGVMVGMHSDILNGEGKGKVCGGGGGDVFRDLLVRRVALCKVEDVSVAKV